MAIIERDVSVFVVVVVLAGSSVVFISLSLSLAPLLCSSRFCFLQAKVLDRPPGQSQAGQVPVTETPFQVGHAIDGDPSDRIATGNFP